MSFIKSTWTDPVFLKQNALERVKRNDIKGNLLSRFPGYGPEESGVCDRPEGKQGLLWDAVPMPEIC